jgi:hypothetical protein
MMNRTQRLNRLERQLRPGDCPCRQGPPEVVTVLYGQEPPPQQPCERCGRPRRTVAVVVFGEQSPG